MPPPDLVELLDGVRGGDRAILGRAITLVESRHPEHEALAADLLRELDDGRTPSHRVGITGVPGVGKSTFIENLGGWLTDRGHRVAVLAVDPSSTRTGGSILGDKTRMPRLANDPNAFVRPSPSQGTLGGVTGRTREAMLVLESAGFDVLLVETVGVGQSELSVAGMTDFFLVLMLAGAGDELQGIKRGLLELADCVAINKADGEGVAPARRAAATYRQALRYLHPPDAPWTPSVLTCSGLEGDGIEEIWGTVTDHRQALESAGLWEARRAHQRVAWFWERVDDGLRALLRHDPGAQATLERLEAEVRSAAQSPLQAAMEALVTVKPDIP